MSDAAHEELLRKLHRLDSELMSLAKVVFELKADLDLLKEYLDARLSLEFGEKE